VHPVSKALRVEPGLPAGLALACLMLAACSEDGTNPSPGSGPALTLIASPATTDTITAVPIQGLVYDVRDASGRPAAGVVVRFSALGGESSPQPSMFVGNEAGVGFGTFSADTTSSQGRAVSRILFGITAGPGRIEVCQPGSPGLETRLVARPPGTRHRTPMSI
jgi:hypothetical protein